MEIVFENENSLNDSKGEIRDNYTEKQFNNPTSCHLDEEGNWTNL
jgi:hypothetical protein